MSALAVRGYNNLILDCMFNIGTDDNPIICGTRSTNKPAFLTHVAGHLALEDSFSDYCRWMGCGKRIPEVKEMKKHVFDHTFQTIIVDIEEAT